MGVQERARNSERIDRAKTIKTAINPKTKKNFVMTAGKKRKKSIKKGGKKKQKKKTSKKVLKRKH